MNSLNRVRTFFYLGLPLVGSQIAQFAVQMIDTLMLGWYDVKALSASVLAGSLLFVVFIVGTGFATAVVSLVSSAQEGTEQSQSGHFVHMGGLISAVYSLLLIPALFWSAPILVTFGQDPDLSAMAQRYLRVSSIGLAPLLLAMVLKSYLMALKKTALIFWLTMISLPLNAALNWVLIFGNLGAPELGLVGAAITSVFIHIATLIVLVFYARYVSNQQGDHVLNKVAFDKIAALRVFRLGLPIGLTNLAELGMFTAATMIIGMVGSLQLAAHGIVVQLTSVVFTIHIGMSQAATVLASRSFSRNDLPDLWAVSKMALAFSLVIVLLTATVFLLTPELLISPFLDSKAAERTIVIGLASSFLLIAALSQLADASQIVALGVLRGIHDTKDPMRIAVFSYWVVGVPLSYYLGIVTGLGGIGVWLGISVGLGCSSLLLWWYFIQRLRRLRTPEFSC